MKILGFNTSPRKKGNTSWIINEILKIAKSNGAETKMWNFNDLDIKPCQSCYSCKKGNSGCIINDDMQEIYTAIENSDVLIFGSPIYMGQMSAQAKIFVDRLYAQFSPRFSPHFKEKNKKIKLILIFTQGNPDADKFKTYIDYTQDMFKLLEFDVKGTYIITDMRSVPANEKENMSIVIKDIANLLI
jgi:multimeric flavodoxin WrbA